MNTIDKDILPHWVALKMMAHIYGLKIVVSPKEFNHMKQPKKAAKVRTFLKDYNKDVSKDNILKGDKLFIATWVRHNIKSGNKPCQSCNEIKPYTDFISDSRYWLGLSKVCTLCTGSHRSVYVESKVAIERIILRDMYHLIKASNNKDKVKTYSFMAFTEWAYENGYKRLFNIWIKSDRTTKVKPSISKIDQTKDYSLNNMIFTVDSKKVS